MIYRFGETLLSADNEAQAAEYANIMGLLGKIEVVHYPTMQQQADAIMTTIRALAEIQRQMIANTPTH